MYTVATLPWDLFFVKQADFENSQSVN